MEQGWDPEVAKFLRKILNTISWILIWMIASLTAGLYFQLGYPGPRPWFAVIIFYVCLVGTSIVMVRYLYRTWKK
ncbi:MAG TPA: hypothetical protein VK644_07450 [Chitinophagaceae bacterium]|nr:hypothetical protein [Chitinophagaceae bacterium]